MTELFLSVLDRSISACWLIPAVLSLRFVFKRAPKWISLVLWGMVAFRLLCPVSIENPLSLVPRREAIPDQIERLISHTDQYTQMGDVPGNSPAKEYSRETSGNPPFSDDVSPHMDQGGNVTIALSVLWVIGFSLMIFHFVFNYWRLSRQICTAVILRDNIFQSEKIGSPFVLGLIRPRIYLPPDMDAQNLAYVIFHEQTHIRHGDHWWKTLGFLLLAIYWFNPLIWLSYALLCRDIELACDERVIKKLSHAQRADYSQALLSCSANRRDITASLLAFGEIGVKERVKSVLRYKKPTLWIIAAALLLCAAVALCFLTDPARKPGTLPWARQFPADDKRSADLMASSVDEDRTLPEGLHELAADNKPESMPQEISLLWETADLDRDGETETIQVREEITGELYVLEVVKKDGTVLWSMEAGIPHTGQSSVLLYQDDGEDCLVVYNPTVYQGLGSYTCRLFSLEGGQESDIHFWKADFELSNFNITDEMRTFSENVDNIMRSSIVLLSTVEGELMIGPGAAEKTDRIFPVRFFPQEEDLGAYIQEETLADFLPLDFVFASGAGAWGTSLTLYPDGSFEGIYEGSEAVAAPAYPYGTSYYCKFSGRFDDITKISEYAYTMWLEELICEWEDKYAFAVRMGEPVQEMETGQEWIEDGHRYISSEALGVAGGEEFVLYLPGTPLAELDREFLIWWPGYHLWMNGSVKTLSSYGIENRNTHNGFFTDWLQ